MHLIDIEPMRQGWGQIWQSGEEQLIERHRVPSPWVIFSMIGALDFTDRPVVAVYINDDPKSCLDEDDLIALVTNAIDWLSRGRHVIIHCFEGKSRSSYLDIAIHMAVLKYTYDQAYGYVKRQHPLCQPNPGFEAQLRRMELQLKEVAC